MTLPETLESLETRLANLRRFYAARNRCNENGTLRNWIDVCEALALVKEPLNCGRICD